MKIRLMTRKAGYNFGTSLQAFALHSYMIKQGFLNEIIDFDEYTWKGKLRLFILDLLYLILKFISIFIPVINRYKFVLQILDSKKARSAFNKFEKEHFALTSKTYTSVDQLKMNFSDCDYLVCGSDQIWSPLHFVPYMFLCFANYSKTVTIGYAPSIGVYRIDQHRSEIADLINKIDCLSIREQRGAEIIKDLTGRDAQVVLDPTLLLDKSDWLSLCQDNTISMSQDYILCYFLHTDDLPIDFIASLQKKTKLRIVNLQTNYSKVQINNAENIGSLGPKEFLNMVKNARYICTNSFHGTIFSVHFERDFYVFSRFSSDSKENQNSRIDTLLDSLGLQSRLVVNHDSFDNKEPINYDNVNLKLVELRQKSSDYLVSSLNNTK